MWQINVRNIQNSNANDKEYTISMDVWVYG